MYNNDMHDIGNDFYSPSFGYPPQRIQRYDKMLEEHVTLNDYADEEYEGSTIVAAQQAEPMESREILGDLGISFFRKKLGRYARAFSTPRGRKLVRGIRARIRRRRRPTPEKVYISPESIRGRGTRIEISPVERITKKQRAEQRAKLREFLAKRQAYKKRSILERMRAGRGKLRARGIYRALARKRMEAAKARAEQVRAARVAEQVPQPTYKTSYFIGRRRRRPTAARAWGWSPGQYHRMLGMRWGRMFRRRGRG